MASFNDLFEWTFKVPVNAICVLAGFRWRVTYGRIEAGILLITTQYDSYIEATQGKIYFSVKVLIPVLLTLYKKA